MASISSPTWTGSGSFESASRNSFESFCLFWSCCLWIQKFRRVAAEGDLLFSEEQSCGLSGEEDGDLDR